MKKRNKLLPLIALVVLGMIGNMGSLAGEIPLICAAEEDEFIIEDISTEELISNPEEEHSQEDLQEEVPIRLDETGIEESITDEEGSLELELGGKELSVPWESVNQIEEEEYLFLEPYEEFYVIFFTPEETSGYAFYFSENVKQDDVYLYEYSEKANQAREKTEKEKIMMAPDGSVLTFMNENTEYIIVLNHVDSYSELGLCISSVEEQTLEAEQQEETVVFETESITEQETVTESVMSEESDIEIEAETEAESAVETEEETEAESAVETEEETEAESVVETEAESAVETEAETEAESVVETEAETEAESVVETEGETEAEFAGEMEGETEYDVDTGIMTEMEENGDAGTQPVLETVDLLLDDGLEMVPTALLPCLEGQEVVRDCMHYSDGTEQILNGETDSYGNYFQLIYEDVPEEDGSVRRTYTLNVIPVQSKTGDVLEKSETVVFRQDVEDEIENITAEEKSSVCYYGKKSWILVQSVPKVTGSYSMKSFGRDVKELYFCAEGENNAVKAETVFELQKDVTYTFLLKLEE